VARLRLDSQLVNQLFPVTGVKFYNGALVLVRSSNLFQPLHRARSNRKKITSVNKRSLQRMVWTVIASQVQFNSLLTLTYGQNFPMNGKRVKQDLNKFITYMRRSLGDFEYCWFLEFQRRGAPHFHLMLTLDNVGQCERELVAELWGKIAEPFNWPYTAIAWPYKRECAKFGGNTQDAVIAQHRRVKTWERKKKDNGMVRYAVKYATKIRQKRVPSEYSNVGRFWAVSSGVDIPNVDEHPTNEKEVREIAYWLGRNLANFEVLPKIIFVSDNLPEEIKPSTMSYIV